MKLFTLLASVLLTITAGVAGAQTYPLFTTSENIDIANINAAHLVHGDMWYDPSTPAPRCEFPKGSGKHVAVSSFLWMSAYDNQAVLKVAAQGYRRANATDYWPGPLDITATTQAQLYATSQIWAKIWKINSSQIDSFLLLPTHTVANTPAAILEWPALGNPYAKGAGGVLLAINNDMAPFVDVNADGQYNPLVGDYPKMKGNQMLWWIINDAGPVHSMSNTAPLKIEIRISAYAYKRGTVADNMIFYEYQLTNKAASRYVGFRAGVFTDADLGKPDDDYMGFDSSHRMAVVYNGKSTDGTGGPGEYGENPPMMGIAILELPGDSYNSYKPAGSFGHVNVNNAITGLQVHNALRQTYTASSYQFTENGECIINNVPGDRHFELASNDIDFGPNETKKIVVALVIAEGADGCPRVSFTGIHQAADTAYKLYWNPTAPVPTGTVVPQQAALHIYPNPATNILHIETPDAVPGTLCIVDALGRTISLPVTRLGNKLDITTAALPNGIYAIRYQTVTLTASAIFVKE